MAAFSYRAVDPGGRASHGVIEASSAASARRMLRERQLLPLAVEAGGATEIAVSGAAPRLFRRRRLGARGLATVTRQLATLIGSEVRIEEALRLVAEQAEAATARALLLDLRGRIVDGLSLAAALGAHPESFPDYYRTSVATGEASGRLSQVLAHLADFVENRHRAQQKIRLALLYPALLAAVSILMVGAMMIYVVPDIVRVFETHGADLPLLTRVLIGFSNGVRRFGWLAAIIMVIIAVGVRRWLATPANRVQVDTSLATRPPFARFSRQLSAARFAGTLATLVGSAVPLVEALAAATAGIPNLHIRAQAAAMTTRVREGGTLHRAMGEAAVFPAMLVAIVASGESSGRLGTALARAAAELDRELDALVSTLVALVEPAVLLMMGGVVLLLVLAILMPIVNLNNLVGQ